MSWQDKFPKTAKCACRGTARIGFVAHEGLEEVDGDWRVYSLHPNKGKGNFWLHDSCAVAIYFCKECLNPPALYNQG
jgi:hypothetical protein